MTAPAVGPDGPIYLTTAELAQRFRMDESSLRNWRTKGYGPLGVRFGGRVLYPLPAVEEWEAAQLEAARRLQRRNSSGFVVHGRSS